MLTRTYAFHTFQINLISHFSIPKSKFWRVMRRNGHKPTSFLLLYINIKKKYVYTLFSIFSPSTNPKLGDLGKKWGSTSSFHIYFFIPKSKLRHVLGKMSWTQLVKYPFAFGYSIRQWDLMEVNLNTIQPFQMFRYVHSEAFCCKCSAIKINNLTKMIFFFPFWSFLTNQKVFSGSLTYFGRNKLISVFRYVHRKMQLFLPWLIHNKIPLMWKKVWVCALDIEFSTYDFFLCSIV